MIRINPYVYPGIRGCDLPEEFLNKKEFAPVTRDLILDAIKDVLKITHEELASPARLRTHTTGRAFYCYFIRKYLGWSLKEIGQDINRDHTTVIHNLEKHENYCATEELFSSFNESIERNILYRRSLSVYKNGSLEHEKHNSEVFEMPELS